jgi:hypothetical protein
MLQEFDAVVNGKRTVLRFTAAEGKALGLTPHKPTPENPIDVAHKAIATDNKAVKAARAQK